MDYPADRHEIQVLDDSSDDTQQLIDSVVERLQAQSALAQLFERPLALRNARIVTLAGPTIERGTLIIKGGRITALGPDVKPPFLAKKIDLAGKTVTPGFIDAWSALGHLGASGKGDPTSTAWDTFDRYARDDFREVLRQGVTTVYVSPKSGPGVAGTGVIVQLLPGEGNSTGVLLEPDAALCVRLGSEQSPIARLKTLGKIRKQFRKALDYRQSLEDYEEDLEEYLEKLKERSEKEEKDDDSKEGDEEKTPPDEKPEPDPEEDKPDGVARPGQRADDTGEERKDKGEKEEQEEDEEEELEKPKKPAPDRKSVVLLRAIDRKLRVRIEAHRSADILNALELATEFRLDIILEGATDAYRVIDAITKAGVPVVLGPVVRSSVFKNDQYRRHRAGNAAALSRAGVRWTLGSGAVEPLTARFVAASAQLAAAHGAGAESRRRGKAALRQPAAQGGVTPPSAATDSGGPDWMRTITTNAARILGVSARLGQLTRGRSADLVVWSGDPGDPASIVERVYVAGKLAYLAPEPSTRTEEDLELIILRALRVAKRLDPSHIGHVPLDAMGICIILSLDYDAFSYSNQRLVDRELVEPTTMGWDKHNYNEKITEEGLQALDELERAPPNATQVDEELEYDVFLSFSFANDAEATAIKERLESAGLRAFMASHEVEGGDDFAEEIREGLQSSRELCLLVSKESLESEWVI
ncbi:MAG: TIR domain-containing protein, partial [Armatimonadetes bacterium]|nr:TIR domain-containing protein [Armatimonadota bacterium]